MEKELKEGILELVKYAKENDKVFIFGDEVYSPDEAQDAMLEHAEEEIEFKEISINEWLEEYRGMLCNK